jgi:hypothetical protein
MAMPDPDRAKTWGGKTIVDRAGATIGACTQVYTDDATGLPEWATARMGNASVLLPLVDAVEDDGRVRVTVGRDEVVLAPPVADAGHVSTDEEIRLYRHYGIPYSLGGSGTILPASEVPPRRSMAATLTDHLGDNRWVLLVAGTAAGVLAGMAVFSVLSRFLDRLPADPTG